MSAWRISPVWLSSTWNSWIGSSDGLTVRTIRSVSPRVPTSE